MARAWTEEERLAAMYLYCQLPFGRLHARTAEIIALADRMARTPDSLAMKLVNFASLDPALQARGIAGLSNISAADRALWERFLAAWTPMVTAAAGAYDRIMVGPPEPGEREEATERPPFWETPEGPTTVSRLVAVRRGQSFFRDALMIGYEGKCCISGCDLPELLIASHIVPWADAPNLRLDPRNGLLLSALHDRAFEAGHLAIEDDYTVIASRRARESRNALVREVVGGSHGRRLRLPARFRPELSHLQAHRARFLG